MAKAKVPDGILSKEVKLDDILLAILQREYFSIEID